MDGLCVVFMLVGSVMAGIGLELWRQARSMAKDVKRIMAEADASWDGFWVDFNDRVANLRCSDCGEALARSARPDTIEEAAGR